MPLGISAGGLPTAMVDFARCASVVGCAGPSRAAPGADPATGSDKILPHRPRGERTVVVRRGPNQNRNDDSTDRPDRVRPPYFRVAGSGRPSSCPSLSGRRTALPSAGAGPVPGRAVPASLVGVGGLWACVGPCGGLGPNTGTVRACPDRRVGHRRWRPPEQDGAAASITPSAPLRRTRGTYHLLGIVFRGPDPLPERFVTGGRYANGRERGSAAVSGAAANA